MVHASRRRAGPHKVAAVAIVLLSFSSLLWAQSIDDCLGCHDDPELAVERGGRTVPMYFDSEAAARGVHAAVDCVACHVDLAGVTDFPHRAGLRPAECGDCHDEELESIAAYWRSTHGKASKAGNADAPRCQDCHGSHGIRRHTDPESKVFVLNIPALCTSCHAEGEPVGRHGALSRRELEARYKDRIHGAGLFRQGLKVAAVCTSCHGSHAILPPADPDSSLHKDRVNAACEQCHNDRESVHRGIVAPGLWEEPGAVPLCVDCHQPHGERRVPYGTNMSDGECLACHGRPEIAEQGRPELFVDRGVVSSSVHGRNLIACAQCHSGARPTSAQRSCGEAASRVNCEACHETQVARYREGIHGSLAAKGDQNAPTCVDCHGSHGILESRVPDGADEALRAAILKGPTHRRNIPGLCARCHRDGAPAAVRNPTGEAAKIEHYRMSIHGKGLIEAGLVASATCVDCHSPHRELPPSDPTSTVSERNIVHTCGKCHDGIYERFRLSIHSREGNPDFRADSAKPALPHCNDCHSAHSVSRTDQPGFRQAIVEQCGKCHERITRTYFSTYHGKASKLGNDVVARCHDCHGSHDILPPGDGRSHLAKDRIVKTCAKCHPNANAGFASYLTHATHKDRERYPQLYWAYFAMTLLLVGTFAFFGVHLIAWLPRSWSLRRMHRKAARSGEARHYLRFTPLQRTLHVMIIVSFLGLTLSGMALKFSEVGWARVLAALLGGPVTAGWIHRFCAVITFTYFGLHLWDLFRRWRASGKSLFAFFLGRDTMIPTMRDLRELVGTFRWFFGMGPRPRYGKWTYWEKFDYFAVFWGVAVIGISGLLLWFPEFATRFLPGWTINVATIIHSEEALLATGFIFTIHFFNTHLRPEKFPMDRVVFTGRMGLEELEADKPGLYDELVASGELEKHLVPAPSAVARRAATVFGAIALAIGILAIALIAHGLWTVGF